MKKILILFCCSLLFTTCKKEILFTHVEGTAQDFYSKQPIANATVELCGPEGKERGVITSANTDANGHFEFEKFRALKTGRYYVDINTDRYHSYNGNEENHIVKNKKNILFPVVVKVCYINFKFINVNPYNAYDNVCFSYDDGEEIKFIPYLYTPGLHSNICKSDMNYLQEVHVFISANLHLKYSWVVTKNNISQAFVNNSLFVQNDTTIIINY